jgi:hypothetical protein
MNNYTVGQITAIFAAAGFHVVTIDEWQTQKILVFSTAERRP